MWSSKRNCKTKRSADLACGRNEAAYQARIKARRGPQGCTRPRARAFAGATRPLIGSRNGEPGRITMALAVEKTSARNHKAVEAAIGALAAKFGNRLVTSQAVREQHGNTLTWIENQPPDAVVFPQTTEDVQDAVRICVQHKVPVIAYGTGTSLEGHINAPFGGVTLDFRDMNRILGGPRRGSRLRGRAGRHAQAAQRVSARSGSFLSDRSRRRRLDRRHVGDARVGHQRGALRHDEGQRARAEGRARERRDRSRPRAARRNPPPATISRACSSARKERSASSPRSP